jgi:hypothetical protein
MKCPVLNRIVLIVCSLIDSNEWKNYEGSDFYDRKYDFVDSDEWFDCFLSMTCWDMNGM